MNNPEGLIKWESDDASQLRSFLDSDTGQRAIALVGREAPTLLDGGDVNKTLVRNGEVKGFTSALQNLFKLCYAQPEQPPAISAYPDVDNDSQWPKELQLTDPTKD